MRRKGGAKGDDPTNSDVISAAKRGETDAIAALYREHVAMVRSYLKVSGIAEPDDVTSEVFVSMVRSLSRFEGGREQFRSWLMTIAHHRMIDHRRRRRLDLTIAVDEIESAEAAEERADVHGLVQPVLLDSQLIEAFSNLTDEQREVLALRFLADLDIETVAAITARPVGAVKSLQHRALQALRRQSVNPDLHKASG
ncbi:MAG: RNA polymerase sigma factor [Acidimicrobiales bacterium]